MALFFARVELHGASSDDYATLHTAMAGGGFYRRITNLSGTVFELPTGEYAGHVEGTADSVSAMVQRLVATTGRGSYILVVESKGWSGFLNKV